MGLGFNGPGLAGFTGGVSCRPWPGSGRTHALNTAHTQGCGPAPCPAFSAVGHRLRARHSGSDGLPHRACGLGPQACPSAGQIRCPGAMSDCQHLHPRGTPLPLQPLGQSLHMGLGGRAVRDARNTLNATSELNSTNPPLPRATRRRPSGQLIAVSAEQFTRNILSSASSALPRNGPVVLKPAAHTTNPTSRFAQPCCTFATPSGAPKSATSTRVNTPLTCANLGRLRATGTTLSPHRAASLAIACPIPPDAPVTRAHGPRC